jgi:hypothetical protein
MDRHEELNDFINGLSFPSNDEPGESIKVAQDLAELPEEALLDLAGYGIPVEGEKEASRVLGGRCCGIDNEFLSQFEGSPLYAQAIALAEMELQQEQKHLQNRIARRAQDRDDGWEQESQERDTLDIQKRQLELELHKLKAQTSAPAAAPSAAATPAQAPVAKTAAQRTDYKNLKWHERDRQLLGEVAGLGGTFGLARSAQRDARRGRMGLGIAKAVGAVAAPTLGAYGGKLLARGSMSPEAVRAVDLQAADEYAQMGKYLARPDRKGLFAKGEQREGTAMLEDAKKLRALHAEKTSAVVLVKRQGPPRRQKDHPALVAATGGLVGQGLLGAGGVGGALGGAAAMPERPLTGAIVGGTGAQVGRAVLGGIGGNAGRLLGAAAGAGLGIEALRQVVEKANEKTSAMSDAQQEKGLGKAVSGLARAKMDPDRKRALAKGLRSAVRAEAAEGDPIKTSAKLAYVTQATKAIPEMAARQAAGPKASTKVKSLAHRIGRMSPKGKALLGGGAALLGGGALLAGRD